MKLARESRYAIEGLVVLAKEKSGSIMQVRDIAKAAGVPPNFLAKIFQKLHRANIVTSSRGAVRGYTLARRSNAIQLKAIILAIEGDDLFDRCIFWSDRCADISPCPMHYAWQQVRQTATDLMQRTTLADLVKRTSRA